MNRNSKLRDSLPYRMGMLRGALLERIRQADQLLSFADKLESLAIQDQGGVADALVELEILAGVVGRAGKNAEQQTG